MYLWPSSHKTLTWQQALLSKEYIKRLKKHYSVVLDYSFQSDLPPCVFVHYIILCKACYPRLKSQSDLMQRNPSSMQIVGWTMWRAGIIVLALKYRAKKPWHLVEFRHDMIVTAKMLLAIWRSAGNSLSYSVL